MDETEQIFPSYLVIFPPSFEPIFCAPKNSEKNKNEPHTCIFSSNSASVPSTSTFSGGDSGSG